MPIVVVNDVGAVGIIKDKLPHELPLNAWSDGQNVRFTDGYVEKMLGYVQVFGTPGIAPYYLLPVIAQNKYNWMYAGLTKVYVYDGNTHTNLTRQVAGLDSDYTGSAGNRWNGVVMGSIPVLNNGVDTPQMWNLPTINVRLQELSNWPVGVRAKVMRGYKSHLLALNVTKDGTNFPQMLKWSHPADPFSVPISWDETDPTKDAGEYTFSDTGDWLVDCAKLRDMNVVYKDNSTWRMQYIGGVEIFAFSQLFGSFGVIAQDCVAEFLEGKHVVLSYGDLIVHDGQQAQSVISGKWKKWMVRNITQSAIDKCFVVTYTSKEEVWACLPMYGSTVVNFALVWNWRTGAIGQRLLPNTRFIGSGLVNADFEDNTWDSDTSTWNSDASAWGEQLFRLSENALLLSSAEQTKLFKLDLTTDENGTVQESFIERTGIGIPMKQGNPPDFTSFKFVSEIWPRLDGTVGATVNIEVGTQTEIGGSVSWQPAKPFVIGQQQKIDVLASGRLLALRVSSASSVEWRLHGYEMNVRFGGNF